MNDPDVRAAWRLLTMRERDAQVAAAVAAERDRCAGIADQLRTAALVDDWHTFDALLRELRA